MEPRLQLPFKEILGLISALTPAQKAQLRQELDKEHAEDKAEKDFIEFLLKGPVYSEDDIKAIENNRKSIAAWRTKS